MTLTPAERAYEEEGIEGVCRHSRWLIIEYEGWEGVRECRECGRLEWPMPGGWEGPETLRAFTDEELEAACLDAPEGPLEARGGARGRKR